MTTTEHRRTRGCSHGAVSPCWWQRSERLDTARRLQQRAYAASPESPDCPVVDEALT